jgi:peroxiredoxin
MLGTGDRAPDFSLADLSGTPVTLEMLLAQGPLVLAFYKASCPVCQYTFPFLERLYNGGRVNLAGVSQDDRTVTQHFVSEYKLSFPMFLDDPKRYPASNAFRITHVPSLFVIETDGKIAESFSGFSRHDLEQLGERFGAGVFREGEQTPAYKPG